MSRTVVLEPFPFSVDRTRTGSSNTSRQKIYIMPTRHGVLFGVMLFAMLLGAVNYNNSMAYILTFLLFSLLLVTVLHTYKNLAGLILNEAPPAAVFAGEIAHFPLILDNRNSVLRYALTFVKAPARKWRLRSSTTTGQTTRCNVNAKQFNRVQLPVKTARRGVLRAGRITVSTSFPLGLFRAWSYVEMKQDCLVYPKPSGQDAFPPFELSESTGNQGKASGTDDFTGFRNYHAGDATKDIAWKIYAQQKGLFIKKFSGCDSNKLVLSWNDVAHLSDTEARLSQLCHWLIEAEAQSLLYGLEIPGQKIDTSQGDKHLHQCLACLARYGLQQENSTPGPKTNV